jgi:hypothetical protein
VGSPVIGLFHRKSDLYRRIQMLLKRDRNLSYRCSKLSRITLTLSWVVAVAVMAAMAGVRPVAAQEKDGPTQRERDLLEQQRRLEAEIAQLKAVQDKAAADRAALEAQTVEERMKARRNEVKVRDAQEADAKAAADRAEQRKRFEEAMAAKDAATRAGKAADAAITGVQIDLVSLANSVVDASGAKAVAEVRYKRISQAAKGGAVAQEELETAEANYITARKRVELLTGIVKLAIESTKRDVDYTRQLVDKGFASRGSLDQQMDKIRMLELIIQSAQ